MLASVTPQRGQPVRGREAQSCFWDHVAEMGDAHSHRLKVTRAHCPLWAVPVMRDLGLAGHVPGWVCVQRSRPLDPRSPRGCWRDGCSSCLSARGCLHSQLVSQAKPGRQRGESGHAVPPTAALLPRGLDGEKWSTPRCIRERRPRHTHPRIGVFTPAPPRTSVPCSL